MSRCTTALVRLLAGAAGAAVLVACGKTNDVEANRNTTGAVCSIGQYTCDGNWLTQCNQALTDWIKVELCASEADCSAAVSGKLGHCPGSDGGLSECPQGMGRCGGTTACDTDLTTSEEHCGACNHPCTLAHATSLCENGECAVDKCKTGFADCDQDSSNGCEIDLQSDKANCGQCENTCPSSGGTASCADGACVISCSNGYGNCDGVIGNGCETTTVDDNDNCGECGTKCEALNGTTHCAGGKCDITCKQGYDDCDGNPAAGCETSLQDSADHCGSCTTVCPTGPHANPSCVAGVCKLLCETGFDDCNGVATDGCEADLASVQSCGACSVVCGNANSAGPTCQTGACQMNCSAGFGDCDGNTSNGCETGLMTTTAHCGQCGNACNTVGGNVTCVSGACGVVSCYADYDDCNKVAKDGCEANLKADPKNCGACGTVCPGINGTPACSAGACAVVCNSGWGNCSGGVADGCETDLNTLEHCGSCTSTCGGPHASASTCANGTCNMSCDIGYGNCNGDGSDGCEAALGSDSLNCGTCKHSCMGGTCSAGICQAAVLASGQARPRMLALDGGYLYWLNEGVLAADGSIYRIPVAGGSPQPLATGQKRPCAIAVGPTGVFYTVRGTNGSSDGAVLAVPKSGGTPFAIASGLVAPCALAIDDAKAYFVTSLTVNEYGEGPTLTVPLTGGTATQLVAGNSSDRRRALAVDGTTLYALIFSPGTYNGWGVEETPKAGGTSTGAGMGGGVVYANRLSIDATQKYFCYGGGGGSTGNCVHSLKGSNQYGMIGTNLGKDSSSVAIDDTYAYWWLNSALMRNDKQGLNTATQIASPTTANDNLSDQYADIVVDDKTIYWTEPTAGKIVALAK